MAITVVPVAVLAWLTWRILDQDRALSQQTLRDQLERSADVIVAELKRDIAALEDQLAQSPPALRIEPSDAAVVVTFADSRIDVLPPGRLPYYPALPASPAPGGSQFRVGEDLEFRRRDYPAAIREFSAIARSSDLTTRAEALVRAARVLRKNGQPESALVMYDSLAGIDGVSIGGNPADLVARDARCAVLSELGRKEALAVEAAAVTAGLKQGRWLLDRASWLLFSERAGRWVGAGEGSDADETSVVLAEGVDRLWHAWRGAKQEQDFSRRRLTWRIGESTVLAFASGTHDRETALVASSRFVEARHARLWSDHAVNVAISDTEGRALVGTPPLAGAPSVVRSVIESGLPWTIRVTSANPRGELVQLAGRRRLLLTGLAVTALLTILAGYLTARATARELAVARLQSDFVAAVSHEFRTPLTSLRHLTELLESGSVEREDRRREYFATLSRETERLHRMVDGLLEFGQMQAGRRQYRLELSDPIELTAQIVADFRDDVASRGRHVDLVQPEESLRDHRVRVDREAIGRALRNLLENAVKYSPEPSPVIVSLTLDGNRVFISVQDQGVGIPRGEHRAIFDQFVRGSAASALNVKGTGIGLSMVRHIVTAHGGDVIVRSESGRGSTFSVILPSETNGLPERNA